MAKNYPETIPESYTGEPFHALPGRTVRHLLEYADLVKYRKPKNANGSRARYFYEYLQRRAARADR